MQNGQWGTYCSPPGSKEGGLAVGDIVDGEQSMCLRDTEKLIQQDVMNL